MRPVSARFLRTLTGSHTAVFRARIVGPGQTGVNPAGTVVPILSGDVQLDGGADIRSTLELTVDGAGQWPTASTSLFTPYGAEVFVERGISYGGGAAEYVSLGYFRINIVDQDDAPDGPIRIAGVDRMAMIIDAKLTSVVQFAPTVQYRDVVAQLVTDAYAAAVIEWDDLDVASDAIGRTAIAESDRYAFLNDLLTGLGKIWYFDYRGVLVIRTPPSPSEPLWTVARGAGGVLVSASRSLSRQGVYNGVLATGEALDTEAPARGLAVDDDPGSPTFWGGPFGKVPREYASPLLTTDSQAQLAAATILRRSLGLPYNLDLTAVPNPALEPDDAIAVGIIGTPVTSKQPRQLVGDSFSRTVVNGMGAAESGAGWSLSSPADSQVNDGVLKKTIGTANTAHIAFNSTAVGRQDFDAYVDVQVPAVATGASLVFGVLARYADGSNYNTMRLEFNPNGKVSAKIARHSVAYGYDEHAVNTDFTTYAAAQWWTVRVRCKGDEFALKAWRRDVEPQPKEWLLIGDDNKVRGPQFGLFFWRLAGNTNTAGPHWLVDNWRVYTVPTTLLSAGEIHVIDTLTIPLTADAPMQAGTREQSLVTIEVS